MKGITESGTWVNGVENGWTQESREESEVANGVPALQLNDVYLSFTKGRPVLAGCDLTVRMGETKVILGGSGEGKSTILRLALGLIRPNAGQVRILGQDISHISERKMRPIRHRVGMVFQGGALFDSLSVAENVGFCPLENHHVSLADATPLIRERLEYVGLSNAFDLMPAELSGGMAKRAAVARAMACSPEMILYDEPTTGIDPIGVRRLLRLINRLRDDFQVTSIVVTHILKDAKEVGDTLAVLHGGKIIFDGTFEQLMNSTEPYIQEFIAEQRGL